MFPYYLELLLVVFGIHLMIFARQALRTRALHHYCFVAVFACLSLSMGLRIWLPALNLGALPLWHLLRWTAWGLSLLAARQWWQAYVRKKKVGL